MMARRKSTKKPRVSEGEAEKVAEEEVAPESSKQQEPSTKDDVSLYMVVMDKVPEPISAEPVGVKPPEVIHWDTLTVDGKEYIRLKRKDDQYEVFNTWVKIVRTCSRSDIEEMFEIGMKLYADHIQSQQTEDSCHVKEEVGLCTKFRNGKVPNSEDNKSEFGTESRFRSMNFEVLGASWRASGRVSEELDFSA
ncbi:hypothetical protein L6452_00587 [Arctium lappa]|uniref:Uncharacterized protein n=1 Tax=Arctium lappa TaxID=4217 RepID=A0ACB9FEY4_ARCLA|nr:hypothetical protein L6452_00587 [Arctium lappa]